MLVEPLYILVSVSSGHSDLVDTESDENEDDEDGEGAADDHRDQRVAFYDLEANDEV